VEGPVYGDDTFSGRLDREGQPESGVRAQLFEHVDGWPGWRLASFTVLIPGQATTTTGLSYGGPAPTAAR
jgi:hypothetical protein